MCSLGRVLHGLVALFSGTAVPARQDMTPLRNPSLAVVGRPMLQEPAATTHVMQCGDSKTVFLLIDNENVQLKCLGLPDTGNFRITIFSGAHQHSIPEQLVRDTQPMGDNCQYVKVDRIGKNAVDFHIAFHLGLLATENPASEFYVVTKDTGFDSLIQHLKEGGLACKRVDSIAEIASSDLSRPRSIDERLAAVIEFLKKRQGKPASRKALKKTIMSDLREQLPDRDLEDLVEQLRMRGVIKLDGNKASYYFS